MSWKFERIFDSDGSELTTGSLTTTISGAFGMAYDGRYVWVSSGASGVAVYEFWGAASNNEPTFDELDELVYPRYDSGLEKKLRLVTFIKITGSAIQRTTREPSLAESGATTSTLSTGETAYYKSTASSVSALTATYVVACAGKIYVANGSTFSSIYEFDPNTHQFVRSISSSEVFAGPTNEYFTASTTYGANSNLCAAGAKLWFVGSSFGDSEQQKLYCYDPLTSTKTTTNIPVRPSRTRTWICDGQNGSVYITNYNNVSVTRFNTSDGSFGATIRVNGLPTRVFSGPDRRIWVNSYAGMLSLVDWDDDGVHNDWGSEFDVLSAAVDPTDAAKLWVVRTDGILVRLNLNDSTRFEMVKTPTKQITASDTSQVAAGTSGGGSLVTQALLGTAVANDVAHVYDPLTDTTHEYVSVIFDTVKELYEWQYTGEIPESGLRDWNISHAKLSHPEQIMFTPSMTFTDSVGDEHTLHPYMLLIQDDKLLALRMDKPLYRDVYAEIHGQAAVASGSLGYFGET